MKSPMGRWRCCGYCCMMVDSGRVRLLSGDFVMIAVTGAPSFMYRYVSQMEDSLLLKMERTS